MKNKRNGRLFARLMSGVLLLGIISGMAGCASSGGQGQTNPAAQGKTVDLMSGITPRAVSAQAADETLSRGAAEFAVRLLAQTTRKNRKDNMMLSPLSILLALSMTANGARGETLQQMEQVLCGGEPLDSLNAFLAAYRDDTENLHAANSIWFRDGRIEPCEAFLQKAADYYGASAYRSPFDQSTVRAVNQWVNKQTDGEIDRILEEIPVDVVLYLINALSFEAEWESPYHEYGIQPGIFTAADGTRQNAEMMYSAEYLYLEDEQATGFIKPYRDGRYSFIALLPNEGVSPQEYLDQMTGGRLLETVKAARSGRVNAVMPKFRCTSELELSAALTALGMGRAFSGEADFSAMSGQEKELCISSVVHKTVLRVDEKGTKGGAVTVVAGGETAQADPPKQVTLDRPFLCAVMDNQTGIPVFLGSINSLSA